MFSKLKTTKINTNSKKTYQWITYLKHIDLTTFTP